MGWWDDYSNTEKAGLTSGLAGLAGGIFGNSGDPYKQAGDAYAQWGNKAAGAENPYWQAGVNAIPQYQSWLSGMANPQQWINNAMNSYQQSPWAKFSTQQGLRAGENAASASGLMGSTPFEEYAQQNAQNISSQDMQNWLANVMGINTQYGAGLGGIMGQGANAANSLANVYGNMGNAMGQSAYGQAAGDQNDMWNKIGGLASIASWL